MNIDILVTFVLIGKTVKAVTAPATVKGDNAPYHCAMHGKVSVRWSESQETCQDMLVYRFSGGLSKIFNCDINQYYLMNNALYNIVLNHQAKL